MKFHDKIGIHSIRNTRKIHKKKSKKSKLKTRRFYYRKPQCKTKPKLSKGGGFTEITESDILRPLKQKAGDLQIEPYAKGTPKIAPFEKKKPDEKENKDADKSKQVPVPEEKKMNTHDYGIDSIVIKDNKNIDTVNEFFRQMLEIESKWERKFIEHEKFTLPNNDSEKQDENLEPKMEYKVSVLQNRNQENLIQETKNYLEPVFDIKKNPNQTLETLNDVIPSVTGDEIIEYKNKNIIPNQPQIDEPFIESKLKPLSIQKKTSSEILPEKLSKTPSEKLSEKLSKILPETSPEILPETSSEILPETSLEILPETSPGTSTEISPETSPETSPEKTQEQKEDELFNETSLALLLSLLNAAKESENSQENISEPSSNAAKESETYSEPETEQNTEELVASAILAEQNQ